MGVTEGSLTELHDDQVAVSEEYVEAHGGRSATCCR